jgi:cytochrome c2
VRILWLLLLVACAQAGDAAPTARATASSTTTVASATASATGSATASAEDKATLTFSIEGKNVRSLSRAELIAQVGTTDFTQFDPYYNSPKTFRAMDLRKLLERGFAGKNLVLSEQHFVLRATDGYTVPLDGKRLLEEGGYIAVDDTDVADGWQPIGRQQVSPGPFYMVWSKKEQQKLETYPRPWQLATIEVSRFENSFPKVVPTDAGEPAQRGFTIFREQCIRCHSINQQGGKVGPDLNVPQSVVEYRSADQLHKYIRDPASFRYGNMPSNPHLKDGDLRDLVAYFSAMSKRKQDPKRKGAH